jgi:DNA sulfur modification protein DndD
LARLRERVAQLDDAIGKQRKKIEECETRRGNLLSGQVEDGFAQEDADRMIELAGRTRQTMQTFLQSVIDQKVDRLSACITESLRYLLHKRSLIERVAIDPATFGVAIYGEGGRPISKHCLSEGEKQVFAISVLWGLARACARPLPTVIDTPMASLDSAHRNRLVERYFPNASYQVIIFSSDSEVDREYYQSLRPHIARAFHLNFDEVAKRTVGEEGYFWDLDLARG